MKKNNFETELKFIETYKLYKNEHPAIREAMCLKVQYPAFFSEIREEDLFAGRIKNTLVGITPDEWGPTAFGYYCLKDRILEELKNSGPDEKTKGKVLEMVEFWDIESTSAKLRAAYPEEMAKYLPSDNWMGEPGIAFPLYRMTGGNVNWEKLLKLGIPGLINEVEEYRIKAKEQNKDYKFFEAMKIALDVLVEVCNFYSLQAKDLISKTQDKDRRQELETISNVLELITVSSPKTLREAIQLFWLYSYVGDIRNYGRMDVYFGDFLANDLKTGILTEVEALKLLQSLWKLIADRNTRVHSRIIIGGKGRRNEANADIFALFAMEASRTIHEAEPQLSLRFYDGMDSQLMNKALKVIGEGTTYPILYNDNVNIKAVSSALNVDEKTAEQYVPFGCGEYIIDHKSFGTPSGVINLLKALEVTLNNGIDPSNGKLIGIKQGEFKNFNTFEELFNAYKYQVEFFVKLMAEHEMLEYKIAGEQGPFLYLSLLYDNCLEKGKGIFSGGIEYLGGTLETYGNTNTADSLTAIKKLIYENQIISKDELLAALKNNFENHEKTRQKLINSPKYGNDNDEADKMLTEVHEHVCNYVKDQAKRTGLNSYLVVIINNSANTLMGHWTSASADGRKSGEPMANGNNPSGGSDKNGVTAFLNSLVKPSPYIHAGAVQNMKFSRALFSSENNILEPLLCTYFENGGAQAMITVIDKDELEKAMEEPEKFSHIFVRVGGFSARFIDLSKDVQFEILSRTLY